MTRKLVLVALVALVVCVDFGFKASCTAPAADWRLTVISTEGGSVAIPGEGTFWYDDEQAVILSARPDPGYRFVNWSGKAQTVSDVFKATATIHMKLEYTIIANFALCQKANLWGSDTDS